MSSASRKNFHVPLSDEVYHRLRRHSARAKRPATALAREAIETWLDDQERFLIKEALSEYARKVAGTPADLDPVLESAGVEHLLGEKKKSRRR